MSQRVEYVVIKEQALGYLLSGSNMAGILHGSVLKGWAGGDGPIHYSPEDVRAATAQDFDEYRVKVPPNFMES